MEDRMDKLIYLDNAATTQVHPLVVEEMLPYFTESYGNPSSVYQFAGTAKEAMEQARESLAAGIGARAREIYFTGGGSESDNWALIAIAERYQEKGKHIITTRIEHHAILHTCEYLEKRGFEITYLDVDEQGFVNPETLEAAIRPDTILISVMAANNEIGTIQPLKQIGELAKAHGILFHTDAVQAFGHIPLNVDEMNIDLLSATAHKLNGPKGVGLLYVRKTVQLFSFIHGGAQERGKRAGTQNVPGIVGFAKAAELAWKQMDERMAYESRLRNHLIEQVLKEIPDSSLNGSIDHRLPNNANFVFEGVDGTSLLILLEQKGICGSAGSACSSGSVDPSHVLLAIGVPKELARGSLRLTLSHQTEIEEIDYTVDVLKVVVERLRKKSGYRLSL